MKNPEQDWLINSYDTGNGQKYHVVADTEDGDYKVRYIPDRYDIDRVKAGGFDNVEDAEQYLIGVFEEAGRFDLVDEVLENAGKH